MTSSSISLGHITLFIREEWKNKFLHINFSHGQEGVKSILIRYRFLKLTFTKYFAKPFHMPFSSNSHHHTQ